jgi:hypothetical protein
MNNNEPSITTGAVAAVIAGAVLLVVARVNRSIDFLNNVELDDLKSWMTVASPLVAAWFIRRRVTPNAKVEERASKVEAMVYAKALADVPDDPPPKPKKGVAKKP